MSNIHCSRPALALLSPCCPRPALALPPPRAPPVHLPATLSQGTVSYRVAARAKPYRVSIQSRRHLLERVGRLLRLFSHTWHLMRNPTVTTHNTWSRGLFIQTFDKYAVLHRPREVGSIPLPQPALSHGRAVALQVELQLPLDRARRSEARQQTHLKEKARRFTAIHVVLVVRHKPPASRGGVSERGSLCQAM